MRDGGTLTLGQVGRGVGKVHLDPLDQRAEGGDRLSLARLGHLGDHVGGELQVPGIVELAGLEHCAPGRGRVAAALEGDLGEGGLCRVAVVRVGREGDHVVRLELVDHERAGADRIEVRLGAFRGLGAHAVLELLGLDDRRLVAHERAVGVRRGLVEGDLDGQVVDHLDRLHAVELGALGAAALRVHAVVGGELDVLGGERRAVRPFQVRLDLPGDRGEVLADAAVLDGGDLLDQPRHRVAVLVVAAKRLDHQARGLDVLGAAREVGVHDRRRLPVDDADLAVRSALGHGGGGDQRQRGGRAHQDCLQFHRVLHAGQISDRRQRKAGRC